MVLYDANCAVGPWPTDRPAYETVDGLLAEMARLGIERALVSHTLARTYNPPYGNRLLMTPANITEAPAANGCAT